MMIDEPFDDAQTLYYYTDLSTALQMNDREMKLFDLRIGRRTKEISFIHYDLHCKYTKKVLYGVVVRNDSTHNQRNKWIWKIDGFLTAKQIALQFGVSPNELPRSSRNKQKFKKMLFGPKSPITEQAVEDTQWQKLKQIKTLKSDKRDIKWKVEITEREWESAVKRSLSDESMLMLPTVVVRNNAHHIEWIQMVRIESYGIFVGVSWLYSGGGHSGQWSVQSIDLDLTRIHKKYVLIGLKDKEIDRMLSSMQSPRQISEIEFVPEYDHNASHYPVDVPEWRFQGGNPYHVSGVQYCSGMQSMHFVPTMNPNYGLPTNNPFANGLNQAPLSAVYTMSFDGQGRGQ